MVPPATVAAAARQTFEDLQAEVLLLQRIIQLKDEQIKLLNFRLFGPKSEKLSSAQMPLLLAEISLSAGEVDTEAEQPEAESGRRRRLPSAVLPHHRTYGPRIRRFR